MTEHLELVKRAKSGDEEAFIRLMESQSDCMYKMAKTILKNEEDTVSEADAREDGYGMAEWEQVLQGLDEKYRLVMLLYYVDGFKIREVSEILDIPAATVKTRLVRGRKQLADEMKMERGRTL